MVATDRPRFKQELVAEPIEDGGARFIDLMDPDSGNVFRFYEVEYALACAMDGERDVAGIVRWAQEELGLSPSPKEVQTVIATLGDLGYLDARPAAESVAPARVAEPAPTAPTVPAKPAAKADHKPEAKVEAKQDEDLARGIVVGKQAAVPMPPVEEFELGASGGTAPAKHEPLPAAADVALGASGGSTAPRRPEPIAVEDIKLGASGSSGVPQKADLSMDLSSDFALNPSDVKEAVRASKVMTAVEIPQDMLDALESKPEPKKPEPKVEAKKPEPKVEVKAEPPKKPEPKVEAKKKSDAPTEKLPDPKAVGAAAEKLDAKVKVGEPKKAGDSKKLEPKKATPVVVAEEKKAVPPAPKPGVSPALIVLLILAIIGAGVFLVWKYVLDKPATGDQTGEVTPPTAPVKKEPPPPPPAPSAKLAIDTPAPVDIKSFAGTIEWIEANDKIVKSGAVIAKLAGQAPIQAALDGLKKDSEKSGAAVDAAQKELEGAKDDAAKGAAQAKLEAAKKAQDTKQAALTAKQADLDKFLVTSPFDGKLAVIAKKDAKVTEMEVIAKVTQDPSLAAVFTAPGGKYVTGSPATLDLKGTDKKLTCSVADVQGDQVKVVCTADASIPPNADVTLD